MTRRSRSGGGVRAAGKDRIEFEFIYEGRRYRPMVARKLNPALRWKSLPITKKTPRPWC